MERRRGQRFKLALPVRIAQGSGVTRDVSTSGVFFEMNYFCRVGDAVAFAIDFDGMSMACEGRVVRVEGENDLSGVAVELSKYTFE